MTSQNTQTPPTHHSCGKAYIASKLCYTPLKCWNCGEDHSLSQEFCYICHGWTLPLPAKATPTEPKMPIYWKIFLIGNTDSSQFKSEQLSSAERAIRDGHYTAVLAAESLDSPYGMNLTKRKAVFLHRPQGEKWLSFTKLDQHEDGLASSRKWDQIKLDDWSKFEDIVGVTSLPSTFPKPDNISLLEGVELDPDVGRSNEWWSHAGEDTS